MADQIAKIKKKQWYPIVAPKQFNNAILGETLVYEPNAMIGKTLSCSLMSLTNDIKKQNVNLHFKIVDIENGKANTSLTGYEIIPYSVKRFVRRASEKMDMSFGCETADNVPVRVKPIIVAKSDVKGSVAAKVRNNAVAFLIRTIKKMTYEEVINDLISHKLQSSMRDLLRKIYPLKVCEIRYVGVEKRERQQEAKAPETAQEPLAEAAPEQAAAQ